MIYLYGFIEVSPFCGGDERSKGKSLVVGLLQANCRSFVDRNVEFSNLVGTRETDMFLEIFPGKYVAEKSLGKIT